ncbi:hypothetical protein VQ02_20320 [Methylobacterium variabile]|jgi:hypothetical protein|uniref:Uncharacterized protein n=1 Tax=Methylobacterium variabile TaxID=298794 RepID=A0A0J6SJ27_9HYPH|nr:hypothetical protein [Methylobacterium variabile]KMO33627.1 hypothetical protein VQ02_20320 [Methylobacterium variabile]
MRTFGVVAVVGLGLLCAAGAASAQSWGGPDYGYRERDYRDRDYGYRDRGPDYGRRDYESRDRDYGYRDRDRGSRDRAFSFDEREYLRCNPDVLRAVRSGQMESGYKHFQVHGRREGRKLTC